jgi:hypothetical protein
VFVVTSFFSDPAYAGNICSCRDYGASHEHHNNDDLPEHAQHAQLVLGSTQAAHRGMATAGAFTARARSFEHATLRDIGITRCDAHREMNKPFWMA